VNIREVGLWLYNLLCYTEGVVVILSLDAKQRPRLADKRREPVFGINLLIFWQNSLAM